MARAMRRGWRNCTFPEAIENVGNSRFISYLPMEFTNGRAALRAHFYLGPSLGMSPQRGRPIGKFHRKVRGGPTFSIALGNTTILRAHTVFRDRHASPESPFSAEIPLNSFPFAAFGSAAFHVPLAAIFLSPDANFTASGNIPGDKPEITMLERQQDLQRTQKHAIFSFPCLRVLVLYRHKQGNTGTDRTASTAGGP